MSLWTKPVDDITIQDIEGFLAQKQREGPRLDYKADVPKDLEKLVAAFANTNGGLIILGVAADPKTNQPIWPPTAEAHGLPKAPGIEERITAICRDNILPSLLPQISPAIDNPHVSGQALVVIRVDESPEAPHAVDGGRKIYERTGSQGKPYDFAHVDRIERLLRRREKIEADREASLAQSIERGVHQLAGRRLHFVQAMGPTGPDEAAEHWMQVPLRWASVIPYYPWRDLCTADHCYQTHRLSPYVHQVQRAPGGSWAIIPNLSAGSKSHGRSALTSKGHIFAIEHAYEAVAHYEKARTNNGHPVTPADFWVSFEGSKNVLAAVISAARQFYRSGIELPGFVQMSVGLLDVRQFRMYREVWPGELPSQELRGQRFPDSQFRADITTHATLLLQNTDTEAIELLDQLAFAFDIPVIPRPAKS